MTFDWLHVVQGQTAKLVHSEYGNSVPRVEINRHKTPLNNLFNEHVVVIIMQIFNGVNLQF